MRQSSNGNNQFNYKTLSGHQEYALISEEDLLSNIDRYSKLLIPTGDGISEEDKVE